MPIAEDPEPRPSEGSEPGGPDPFEGLVLDEEFIRGATVKEQSGRTRMLTARWKRQPPVDPGGRNSVPEPPKRRRLFGRRPRPVDPWGNVRRGPRRNWQTPVFVLLAIAVVAAGLNVDALHDWYSSGKADGAAGAAPRPVETVAPETARPTTAPPAVPKQTPTVDHPWAGSPAEGWPSGPEAIVLPQAQATGVFDEEQVAAQLKLVKDFLIASNLDPQVVAGARPQAALDLLDREDQDHAVNALASPTEQNDPTYRFSRFSPRDAIPVGDVVKVQGRTSVEGDGEKGVRVHTDYTFVYALRPGPEAGKETAVPKPSGSHRPTAPEGTGTAKPVSWTLRQAADVDGSTQTARTIVRRVATFRFYNPARFRANPKKINIEDENSEVGNSACYRYDGFYHPQFDQFAPPAEGPGGAKPSGPATDPYDRSKPLPESDGGSADCGSISRS
ncbi:hypothetical protein [Kitasatospora sp. NPDC050543]|uniref:SCO2583/SCO2584 N-terminal domain-containing protein n=1 Tax=Kitasatospora sp. NPDC050543 TaxID=3364054 RepID=UPI00379E2AE7